MSSTPEQPARYFTVEEANKRLPLVRAIVQDIVNLFHDVHERRERLSRVRQTRGSQPGSDNSMYDEELEQVERDLDKDIDRLQGFVNELKDLGVEMKDPVQGLIDFPTKIDGRDAYLCWQLGESEVAYWHELDAGFRGRQSLLEGSSVSGDVADDNGIV